MIKEYIFNDGLSFEFDDQKTVKELLSFANKIRRLNVAFKKNNATVFQSYSSKTSEGWFTTNVNLTCAEEIENQKSLCYAYSMPNVFYYAEGGWGHHMISLGNHPKIDNPISLKLHFGDFKNTVVIAGRFTFQNIIDKLLEIGCIPDKATHLVINSVNPYREPSIIRFTDSIMQKTLVEFKEKLPDSVVTINIA